MSKMHRMYRNVQVIVLFLSKYLVVTKKRSNFALEFLLVGL